MLCIHERAEPNIFSMTSPHSIRKDTSPVHSKTTETLGTGSTPYLSENPLSSQILRETNIFYQFSKFLPRDGNQDAVDCWRYYPRFGVLDLLGEHDSQPNNQSSK
jgi:hypothetical protein